MVVIGIRIFLAATYLLVTTTAVQHPNTDSILDLINTKQVERLISERKQNISKNERRYLIENNIDDNYEAPSSEYDYPKLLPEGDVEIPPETYPKTENPRIDVDLLFRRNNNSEPYRGTDLLQDLQGYAGRKVLKSSKNALFVTKKEYLKKDWCKTEVLVQKVKEEGCYTRTIINRFCYGQCNSFYIPKNPKKRGRRKVVDSDESEEEYFDGPAFKSCGFCRPAKYTWITVILRCPSMTPQFRKKRVQRIKTCKCTPADVD